MEEPNDPSLNDLCDDCLIYIFNYFPTSELLNLSTVCRRWYNLIQTPTYLKKINLTETNFTNIRLRNVKSAKIQSFDNSVLPFFADVVVPRFTSNLVHLEVTFLPTKDMIKHLRSIIKLSSIVLAFPESEFVHSWQPFWKNNRDLRKLKLRLAEYAFDLSLHDLPDTLTKFVAINVELDASCLQNCKLLTRVKIDSISTGSSSSSFSNFNFPLSNLTELELESSTFLPSSVFRLRRFSYDGCNFPRNMNEFLEGCSSTLESFNAPHFHFKNATRGFPKLKQMWVKKLSDKTDNFPNLMRLKIRSRSKSKIVRNLNLRYLNDFNFHSESNFLNYRGRREMFHFIVFERKIDII
jgi:hypothetical protein